jgi:hypothetical protein
MPIGCPFNIPQIRWSQDRECSLALTRWHARLNGAKMSAFCSGFSQWWILTRTEASTIRRFAIPLTLNFGSTTPSGVPYFDIKAVADGCQHVPLQIKNQRPARHKNRRNILTHLHEWMRLFVRPSRHQHCRRKGQGRIHVTQAKSQWTDEFSWTYTSLWKHPISWRGILENEWYGMCTSTNIDDKRTRVDHRESKWGSRIN